MIFKNQYYRMDKLKIIEGSYPINLQNFHSGSIWQLNSDLN